VIFLLGFIYRDANPQPLAIISNTAIQPPIKTILTDTLRVGVASALAE
jgi:hypothetical protein